MTDIFHPTKRSEVMAAIRGKGNKSTELALATELRRNKLTGWRRHVSFNVSTESYRKKFPKRLQKISPDFTFRKERLVVFVDGCFWHMCPRHYQNPKGNAEFWDHRIRQNVERDKTTNAAFRRRGWSVLRFWEHELASPFAVVERIRRRLIVRRRCLADEIRQP